MIRPLLVITCFAFHTFNDANAQSSTARPATATPFESCVRSYVDQLLASKRNYVSSYRFSTTEDGFVAYVSGSKLMFDRNELRVFIQFLVSEGVPGERWLDHFGKISEQCK